MPEGAVATEMLDLYQVDGIITEPAGALATAAARQLDRPDRRARSCAWSPGGTTT